METAYQNISIEVPGSDMEFVKTIVSRMGWRLRHEPTKSSRNSSENKIKAIKELRNCVTLPPDFDYKKEVGDYLETKYNFKG